MVFGDEDEVAAIGEFEGCADQGFEADGAGGFAEFVGSGEGESVGEEGGGVAFFGGEGGEFSGEHCAAGEGVCTLGMEEDEGVFGASGTAVDRGRNVGSGEAGFFVAEASDTDLGGGFFVLLVESGYGLAADAFGIDETTNFTVGVATPPFAGFPPEGKGLTAIRWHFSTP